MDTRVPPIQNISATGHFEHPLAKFHILFVYKWIARRAGWLAYAM